MGGGKGGNAGGGTSGGGGSSGGGCATPTVMISSDPKHAMMVTQAEITAAAEKTYNIMGTQTHNHTVKVTAAMFTMLGKGMTIMVNSSMDSSHMHMITVKCS